MSHKLEELNRYYRHYKSLYPTDSKPVLLKVGILVHYQDTPVGSYISGYSIIDQKKFDHFITMSSLL